MKKGFTLVEIIVSIGTIGLVVIALLLVIYNIQLMQSKQMFGQTVAKKAEFFIVSNILTLIENYREHENLDDLKKLIKDTILNKIKNDDDLRNIKINNISVSRVEGENTQDMYLRNLRIYGNSDDANNDNNKNILKNYFLINIDYEILGYYGKRHITGSNQKLRVSLLVPLFLIEDLPHNYTPGNGSGTGIHASAIL